MKLICCNFKMNLLKEDINNYLDKIKDLKKDNIIFFPSIPYINSFRINNFQVGSQDISFNEFGSFTGETSIMQLKELGISHTIIGHSERRMYFDDDKYITKKINLALKNDIKVILCIGEKIKMTQEETNNYLKDQIDDAIKNNLELINNNNLIIAYEPIWAIGSGVIPSNNCLDNTISFIKDYIFNNYELNLKVLYGGSVNDKNIDNLEEIKKINGYLIGSYSLKPENILTISSKLL